MPSTADALQPGRRRSGWSWACAAALLAPYALLLALVPADSETPYSDDFDYAAAAWHLTDTGQLRFSDWPAMTLVGHVVWGSLFCKVFGSSWLALRLSMMTLSAGTAGALYLWCRRLGHGRGFALFCALGFAVNPLTVCLQYSFMTDLSGAAAATWLVLLQPRRTAGWRELLGYSLLGGAAYLTRQTAAIPFLAVCAAAVWTTLRDRTQWMRFLLLAAPFAMVWFGYTWWLTQIHGTPAAQATPFLAWRSAGEPPARAMRTALGLALQMFPIALLLAPTLSLHQLRAIKPRAETRLLKATGFLAANWGALKRFRRIAAAIGLVVAAGCWTLATSVPPPYGGEIFDAGLRAVELPAGHVPESLQGPTWRMGDQQLSLFRGLAILLSLSTLLTIGLHWRVRSRPVPLAPGIPLSLAEASLALNVGLLLFTPSFLERYLLGLLPLAWMAVAERMPPAFAADRRRLAAGWAATLLLGLLSLIGIQDGMERSKTFWNTARELHSLGVTPDPIDAGLAYAGHYRYTPTYRGEQNIGPYLNSLAPSDRNYVIGRFGPQALLTNRPLQVSFDECPGYRPIARRRFASWARTGDVLVLLRDDLTLNDVTPAAVQRFGGRHSQ